MVTDNATVTTTDYGGNYIYENSSLKFINQAEGYIEPDGKGGYDYVFQYKDHLGNVRVSYSDADKDGVVDGSEIVEESNYYPFGLKHKGYNNLVNGTHYPYDYNGKENNEELGLNWHDFGARNYDAALGRWINLDPLAENSRRWSLYNYAYNNPIYFIDPDGMQATDWYENAEGQIIYDENITSQEDLDAAGIDGTYIDKSFVGKDQNGDYYNFGEDGEVSGIDADSVETDTEVVDVVSTEVEDNDAEEALASMGVATAFLLADDVTGIGVVDDVAIPFVIIGGLIWAGYEALTSKTTLNFSKVARGNQRDTGLQGVTDEEIAAELATLTGKKLTKEEKARKRKLQKEQKARGTRNTQKKKSEKGTGTGRQ